VEKRRKEKRRNEELNKYIHRYQLSWETERTDLRVTEYRYPPFDRGWRKTSKTRVHQKETPKKYEKNKIINLYIHDHSNQWIHFTRKIIKVSFQTMSIFLKNIIILWILNIKGPIRIHMFHNKWTAPS
jgi:hypothetical protein